MKKSILVVAILTFGVLSVFAVNYLMLGKPLADVVESDSRNSGIDIAVHYEYYANPSVLVFNIKSISGKKSAADVFRVFLQYTKSMKSKNFEKINLASKGKTKFFLKGGYFNTLGLEFGSQNPVYTMRIFPEHVYKPNGERAFGSWTGGLIGVFGKQMEDFTEFHKQWYIEDLTK